MADHAQPDTPGKSLKASKKTATPAKIAFQAGNSPLDPGTECLTTVFHDLKGACGTLNAAKMSKRVLNAFMCHRSSTTTEKYYINT